MTAKSRRAGLAEQAARALGAADSSAKLEQETTTAAETSSKLEEVSPRRSRKMPAARVAPVRLVVELQPVEHQGLRRLADRYADDLGLPSVAKAEVLRVLLALAQEDAHLADRVGEELARTGGTRRK